MATELTGAIQPQQQNAPASSIPTANVGSAGTANATADSVVTQAAKPDQTDVGKDDAHRRQASKAASIRRNNDGIPRLDQMAKSGVKTVVGFDVSEANHIYIRVQDSNTGQQIAEIPSKEFVQFLRQRFEELSGSQNQDAGSLTASV